VAQGMLKLLGFGHDRAVSSSLHRVLLLVCHSILDQPLRCSNP
jgi:hypothetical protein